MEPPAASLAPSRADDDDLSVPVGGEGSAPVPVPEDLVPPRTYRIAHVASVEVRLPEQYPTVVLEDAEQGGRIAFRIGTAEGVALAHAVAGTGAPRPSTHELFATVLERAGIDVLAVRICGRVGATHLAELELVGAQGREILSCRPSDGMCLALRRRVPAPILVDERLFLFDGDVEP